MSISPAPDSSARIGLGLPSLPSIPRQRTASPTISDVTSGRVGEVERLAAIAGPAGAASGLEALDRSLTVKASFYDPMFEEDSVIVGSPIPDLLIEGVRLDGLSAERIKRETEVHVARWFGIGAEFFAVTITEINHIPVVEVLDHVDRVLITSASLSLAPNGEVPAA